MIKKGEYNLSMHPIFLEGQNIFLSPLSNDDDLEDYVTWINDQKTTLYLVSGKFPTSINDLKDQIDRYRNNNMDGMLLGIFLKKSKKHIGNIKLHQINWINRSGEIGLLIGDKKSRGKGYATEAIALLVSHAFNKLNLRKLYIGTVKGNEASKKVFEKIGFKIEGVLKSAFYLNGAYLDCYRMGLLRRDFTGLSAKNED